MSMFEARINGQSPSNREGISVCSDGRPMSGGGFQIGQRYLNIKKGPNPFANGTKPEQISAQSNGRRTSIDPLTSPLNLKRR